MSASVSRNLRLWCRYHSHAILWTSAHVSHSVSGHAERVVWMTAGGMDDRLEREPSSPLALGKPFVLKPLACRPFATHQTFHGESH